MVIGYEDLFLRHGWIRLLYLTKYTAVENHHSYGSQLR